MPNDAPQTASEPADQDRQLIVSRPAAATAAAAELVVPAIVADAGDHAAPGG